MKMPRRCPGCGAEVPPESLNCPNCYTDIPRDTGAYRNGRQERSQTRERIAKKNKSRLLSLILATVPVLVGLLGLARIYRDCRDTGGWCMLGFGFLVYLLLLGIVFTIVAGGFLGILLIIPTLLVGLFYLFLAFVNFVTAWTGSLYGKYGL